MWKDEIFKEKISEQRKGRIHTEETKEKIGAGNTGKILSENTKEKISKSRKEKFNNMNPEEYKEWYSKIFTEERNKKMSDSHKGKKCPWNEKTNKDPEKIRKTAEAHTGMKRSEQVRKNISESMKGRIPTNKGNIWCYNPETKERKTVPDKSHIPDGWIKGQNKNKTPKGKIWCHDPYTKEQKTCYENEIPEEWVRGMGKRERK